MRTHNGYTARRANVTIVFRFCFASATATFEMNKFLLYFDGFLYASQPFPRFACNADKIPNLIGNSNFFRHNFSILLGFYQ